MALHSAQEAVAVVACELVVASVLALAVLPGTEQAVEAETPKIVEVVAGEVVVAEVFHLEVECCFCFDWD